MNKVDAVTLAILKGRLEQIADEMDATLFRSAFNPIIAELSTKHKHLMALKRETCGFLTTHTTVARTYPIFVWLNPSFAMAVSFVFLPPLGIGTMLVATYLEIIIRQPLSVFRRAC